PTARAATAMHVDVADMFVPMLPAMLACVAWTFVLAYLFGRRERARLGGTIDLNGDFAEHKEHRGDGWRFYFNWLLTALLIL
ncbi:citrate transporter, partial [Klebsiella pneumoniae]|nr:citrate transporter [Klebsiella pneumoniae]